MGRRLSMEPCLVVPAESLNRPRCTASTSAIPQIANVGSPKDGLIAGGLRQIRTENLRCLWKIVVRNGRPEMMLDMFVHVLQCKKHQFQPTGFESNQPRGQALGLRRVLAEDARYIR